MTEPKRIGEIMSQASVACVGCEKFEECLEPPALIARIALEIGARRAAEQVLSMEAQKN